MLSMTRKEFNEISFDELMEKAIDECDYIHSYNDLLKFAKYCIDESKVFLAVHVLKAVGDLNEYKYYDYDVNMGTLEFPTEITEKLDIEPYIDFKEE
nr:MAG TPA: hypothetical protein [Caudoviricetes sp.]